MWRQLVWVREERAAREARIEERKSFLDLLATIMREEVRKAGVSERGAPARNYAEAARRKDVTKVSGVKGPVLPVPKRLVIRHENKESEEVEKKLKELVRPSDIGLKVKRLTRIRNGVILEAESEEVVEKLIRNEALQRDGIKGVKPNLKNLVVMMYDVNSELSDEEIKDEVFGRKMVENGIPK